MAFRIELDNGEVSPWMEDVRRLEIKPGDAIVITLPGHPTPSVIDDLKRALEEPFPGVGVLLLADGAEISIMSNAD